MVLQDSEKYKVAARRAACKSDRYGFERLLCRFTCAPVKFLFLLFFEERRRFIQSNQLSSKNASSLNFSWNLLESEATSSVSEML